MNTASNCSTRWNERCASRNFVGALAAALLGGVVALPASASLSQADIMAPGGFLGAFAGIASGGLGGAGTNVEVHYDPLNLNLDEHTFTSGVATASSSYSGALGTNSASGYATIGALGFAAANSAENPGFSSGAVNGGWNDSMTVTAPGVNGQSAVWLVDINVSGTLAATGFAGLARFATTAYQNNIQLRKNDAPGFSAGGSSPISTDRQSVLWQLTTAAPGEALTWNVQDVITYAFPVIIGQPFDFGIYAFAHAGKRSSSAGTNVSTSNVAFTNTLTWGGSTVLLNGQALTDVNLSSASGVNYALPINAIPLPPAMLLLIAPLGVLAARAPLSVIRPLANRDPG